MKKEIFLLTLLVVWTVNSTAKAVFIFTNLEDGMTHVIDDDAYWQGDNKYEVYLDFYTANNPGTHVDLLDNSVVYSLIARNNSTIDVKGGIVRLLRADDSGTITMSSGSAEYIQAWESGVVTVSGGTIGSLDVGFDGTIYLVGSNFEIDGQSLSYGDKLSNFGELTGGGLDPWYSGTIMGLLNDGSALNCDFEIYNTGYQAGIGDIIIIPEPATLSLLALGAFFAGRKRRKK